MKYDCDVVRDLIPLVRDGVASLKTQAMVEEHVAECAACRAYLREPDVTLPAVAEPAPPQDPQIVQYGQRVKARRRRAAWIVGSIFTFLLLVIGGLAIFIYYLVWGGPPTATNRSADYGKFENFKGYSNLAIFPKTLPASAKIIKYEYFSQDTLFDPTIQIYLETTLSEADYQAEVKRLAAISARLGEDEQKIVYDTAHFVAPAYVMALGYNLTYEYALLLEEQQKIIYVFTQFIRRSEARFNPAYLPNNFHSFGDSNTNAQDGYNLYYFKRGEAFQMEPKR